VGLLSKWVKYNEFFFIYTFFRELIYESDPSTDFHAWWFKRRGLAQGCALWGIVDIAPNFVGEIPQTLNFGGVHE